MRVLTIKGRGEGNFFLSLCSLEFVVIYAYIKKGRGEGNVFLSLCFLESIDILNEEGREERNFFLSQCFLESIDILNEEGQREFLSLSMLSRIYRYTCTYMKEGQREFPSKESVHLSILKIRNACPRGGG